MSENQPPVPDFLPEPPDWPAPPDLEEMVLGLYQRVADYARRLDSSERQAKAREEAHGRKTRRVIALLAAERFEFERLMRRILPDLRAAGADEAVRVLTLYARTWDANLRRSQVEVCDLTGSVLTDELSELVEVESALPDSTVSEPVVRETLSPLVKVEGHVVSLSKVITSVPAPSGEATDAEVSA